MTKNFHFLFLFLICCIGFSQTPGTVDPGFYSITTPTLINGCVTNDPFGNSNGSIRTMITQPDGKIIIGGQFSTYNGKSSNYVNRINNDGSNDLSFTSNLQFLDQNLADGYYTEVNTIGLQSSGKIIVGGGFVPYTGTNSPSRILRLNIDGSLDTTFSLPIGFNNVVWKLVVLPDDKILIAGRFTSYNGTTANRIIKLNSDGTVDTAFNYGSGANEEIRDLIVQSNGKIIICGKFSSYSGNSCGQVVRLNSDGTFDNSFSLENQFLSFSRFVTDITLQTDGKIIARENIYDLLDSSPYKGIIRFNPDGSVDTSFNVSITTTYTNISFSTNLTGFTEVCPDGKIIINGYNSTCNGISLNRLLRLNSDGSVDTSFTTGRSFENGGNINAVIIMPDTKIIAAGGFDSYDEFTANSLVRLYDNGKKDPTFNIGYGFNNEVNVSVVQSDDKIIIGGSFDNYDSFVSSKIIRLKANGLIDDSFNVGNGFDYKIRALAIQTDGKIIAAGDFNLYNGNAKDRIVRINIDGSIDNSFNLGIVLSGHYAENIGNYYISTIAIQTNGKIIIGGNFKFINGISQGLDFARLNSDGSLDSSYDLGDISLSYVKKTVITSDNKIIVSKDSSLSSGLNKFNNDFTIDNSFIVDPTVKSIINFAIQPDNKIIAFARVYLSNSTNIDHRLVRLNANGSIDTSFNYTSYGNNLGSVKAIITIQTDGMILLFSIDRSIITSRRFNNNGTFDTFFPHNDSDINTVSLQSDGKILLGGLFGKYVGNVISNNFTRLNANGVKDITFNNSMNNGFDDLVYTTVIQNGNKIIVGGDFNTYNETSSSKIIRLNNDLTVDNAFNIGSGFNSGVKALAIQTDGRVLVGGNFTYFNGLNYNRLIRLDTNGNIDLTFNVGLGFNGTVTSIVIQSDGKILIGGNFSTYKGIIYYGMIRLNSDGSIDNSFIIGNGFNNSVTSFAIQPDGKIIVCGNFTSFNGIALNRITRLYSDGSLDPDLIFNLGSAANNSIRTVALQPDGKILIGGDFTTFNNVSAKRIARLNNDMSIDASFNQGYGFENPVNQIVLETNGGMYVCGDFYSYNGYPAAKLLRLNTNATIDATFNTQVGFNNEVISISVQNDGKVITGGSFTNFKSTLSNRFVRLFGASNPLTINEENLFANKSLTIYPNPVSDILTFKSDIEEFKTFEIYDVSGKKVQSSSIEYQKTIDVSLLKSGMYIILFKNNSKVLSTKFFKK